MKQLNQAARGAWQNVALASAVLVAGLAGSAQAGEALAGDGIWRAAYVVQAIDAQAAAPLVASARDCRTQSGSAANGVSQWVLVRYRRVPGDVYMVAPVAPGLTLKQGQSVNMNVQGCQPVAQVRDAAGALQG